MKTNNPQIKLDDIDKKILNILIENSRLSYRQIAKEAKVSVVTVINRTKKLEKEGIIKHYTTSIDYKKLGYDFPVLIQIRTSRGQVLEATNKIALHPNVLFIYDITGPFDIAVIARFKTRDQLNKYIKELAKEKEIERTNTTLILYELKEEQIKF